MIQTTSDGALRRVSKQFQDVRDTAETEAEARLLGFFKEKGEIAIPSRKANREGEFGRKGKPTGTGQ